MTNFLYKTMLFMLTGLSILPSFAAADALEIAAGDLRGTFQKSGDGAPIVLIVPGSGPTDRNGNNPQGVNANSYKHLAEQMAAKGISSVRVDKRGMFGSVAGGNPNDVSVQSYANDYRNWIEAIRAETGDNCIYLLGHSEGALMVSAAAIDRTDVCGLILVSGVGRPMGDVLREQLKANPANRPILKKTFRAIDDLEAGNAVDLSKLHPAVRPLFAEEIQGFLRSLFAADPAELLKKANQRTLIIQGSNDLQVSVEDAELLAAAVGVSPVIIEGMNHVLKNAPTDRAENFATYGDPDLPVVEEVIDVIDAFTKP